MDAKRVHALGKVEEVCWKNCTGEWQVKLSVMWESRRGKNSHTAEDKTDKLLFLGFYYYYYCLFYLGTEKTVKWRKWKVSCVIVASALSLYHQIELFYVPLLSPSQFARAAWGLLCFALRPACACSSTSLLIIRFYVYFFFLIHSFLSWLGLTRSHVNKGAAVSIINFLALSRVRWIGIFTYCYGTWQIVW